MSILKELNTKVIKETGAAGSISANVIATVPAPMMKDDRKELRRQKLEKDKKKKVKMMRRKGSFLESLLQEKEFGFDDSDVISKLKSAEKATKVADDTVSFGLEDEDGNIIRVYVRADQADAFEKALQAELDGNEDDMDYDTQNSVQEIAEVLYKLKDKFDIVNIEWPTLPQDEEEEQEVSDEDTNDTGKETGDETDAFDADNEMEDIDTGDEEDMTADTTSDEDTASLLQKVIDMMSADADAKKAEAEAKKAEADAEIAKASTEKAAKKVKQEEEILDMEDYYSAKSEEDKEAKRLAKLAKYKHDLAKDKEQEDLNAEVGTEEEMPEEEEEMNDTENTTDKISLDDLIKLLRKHVRAQ